jgi:phosphoribosylamine-glycine ligase
VSELVGDVMESAIEERLARARITFRKTKRAERVPGFEQAPDFFVPTEVAPAAIIEAKITGDDGTARDKVSRVLNLATMRDHRERAGQAAFELVACVDGRGFRVRREDMRKIPLATHGKVFTIATLDRLIEHTRLREFLPRLS